jgi:hypothetical protein
MEVLMKYTIVSPKNLYQSLLPFRCNKKLLFCLCRTCVLEQNTSDECHHYTDAERALIGEARYDRLQRKATKLRDIHEIYLYQVTL